MGYAAHVGRVGALAVALGVGMAVASNGGVAFADASSDSSSGESSSPSPSGATSSDPSNSTPTPSGSTAATTSPAAGSDSTDAGGADKPTVKADGKSPATSTGAMTNTGSLGSTPKASESDTDDDADDATTTVVDDATVDGPADDPVTAGVLPIASPKPPKNDSPTPSATTPAPKQQVSAGVSDADDAVDEVDAADDTAGDQSHVSTVTADTTSAASSDRVFTTVATALRSIAPPPAPAVQQPPTLIGVVTQFVSAVLAPLLTPGTDSPIQIPFLTAALSLVRNEFDKLLAPRQAVAPQQSASLVNALQALPLEDQHVLVIGIDGTNLSRILALPAGQNANFLQLLATSTSAAPSIVGHTTISNPSWTSILTGAWGERTGVINNVFTPWTYDRFATMFNQIEGLNEDIDTTVIANWNVINAISAAGTRGADNNLYVAQLSGDTNWLATDDRVAQLTIDAINGQSTDPSALFSYFVGVDENGHMYGGASPEYQAALVNMDKNLGLLMDAVAARELATGEDWTIIVVTDHGHQPQKGFGHGFNSPDESATFVIVDGPGFADGNVNTAYQIVDTTPTVLQIFGGGVQPRTDGVPLQSLGAGTHYADIDELVAALKAELAQIKSPDFLTDTALTLRTIFATIPYYIYDFGLSGNSGLPGFLALPAQLLFSGLYIATNIPAQLVALGTGVYGARLFPILPPPPPNFTPVDEAPTMTTLVLLCGSGVPSTAADACGATSVA